MTRSCGFIALFFLGLANSASGRMLKGFRKPLKDSVTSKAGPSTSLPVVDNIVPQESWMRSTSTTNTGNSKTYRFPSSGRVLPSQDPFSDLEKPLRVFQQCFESCGVDLGEEWWALSNNTTQKTKTTKPPCCKGGVSAIKMAYSGITGATLFLSEAVPGVAVVDSCSSAESKKPKKSNSARGVIKFASCDYCFPAEEGGSAVNDCNPLVHLWDDIQVQDGSELCLISFDESLSIVQWVKMPTDVTLIYQYDGNEKAHPLTIHTSCSKPIYPPYALQLDSCDGTYVDLSEGVASPLNSTSLRFINAVSAKHTGTLVTSTECERDCCEGGASVLKMRFAGNLTGLLTVNTTIASRYSQCVETMEEELSGIASKKAPKGSSKEDGLQVKLIPCADPCVWNPLHLAGCDHTFEMTSVQPGKNICVGLWDPSTRNLVLYEKLPTNLDLFFIPEESTLGTFTARVHTSCSKPLWEPYGQPFSHACNDPEPVTVLDPSNEVEAPHLEFVDGYSRKYAEAARYVASNVANPFYHWSFGDCKCTCGSADRSEAPSSLPTTVGDAFPGPGLPDSSSAPSNVPTRNPTSSPTHFPTTSTSTPTLRPTQEPTDSPTGNTDNPSRSLTQQPTTHPTDSSDSPTTRPSMRPSSGPTQLPSSTPSSFTTGPTAGSTAFPTSEPPTTEPSHAPTPWVPGDPNKGPGSPQPPHCDNDCSTWAKTSCVFIGEGGSLLTDQPCDVSLVGDDDIDQGDSGEDGGRRVLEERLLQLALVEGDGVFQSFQEERDHHLLMLEVYMELLSSLE